jgi:hypothetical protein
MTTALGQSQARRLAFPFVRILTVVSAYRSYSEEARRCCMNKYSEKAQEKVEETMHEMKKGELKSGKSGKKVTSKKQAVAIGLSKARKEGAKVPSKSKKASKSKSTKK